MLDRLRRASENWIGRGIMALIMCFIIVPFAIWGIGNNTFQGYGANSLASVGKIEITADAYRNAYQTQMQKLQQQLRQPITNDQARAMGIDTQVLGKLIANAALDNRSAELGLAMSDKEIVKSITVDPAFRGPTGKFDQTVFNQVLRDNGYTEQTFVKEQRSVYLRREIADALLGTINVPDATVEAIDRYRNEARSVDYFVLPESAAGEVAAPAADVLKKYFEDRKQTFRAPEYRKIVTLAVTPTILADTIEVSDADALAAYDQVKDTRFATPEKRQLQQIVFANDKDAADAAAKIKTGATFDSVAADFEASVVDIGTVARTDMFDKAQADAAFALAEGAVSEPVKTQFGVALIRDVKTEPATIKPFAEVSATLKAEVAQQSAKSRTGELRNKIEDQRTSGKSLADAAQAVGLTARTIDAMDRNGADKNGAPVLDLVERDALLRAAWNSDIGVDNDLINTRDGGNVWFEVLAIEPARDLALSDIQAKVEAAWRDDELARRLGEKAGELVKKINGGVSVEDVAKAAGDLQVLHVGDAKRNGTTSIPPSVVTQVFNVTVGTAGSASGEGRTRVVFKVLDSAIPTADLDSETNRGVRTELKQQFTEDILIQYLARLQTEAGVKINQNVLRTAISGGAPDDLNN